MIVKGLLPTSGSHHFVAADRVEEIYERGVAARARRGAGRGASEAPGELMGVEGVS